MSAWQQVVKIQGEIRKARLEEKKRQQEQIETILQWGLVTVTVIVAALILVFIFANV